MPVELGAQQGVRLVKNVMVPASDGVSLGMDLHVPDRTDWMERPCPVLLEYIPYRKDDAAPYTGAHFYFARHGYVSARLDCRGTGSSGGVSTDEYTPREQLDGVEAIEWIARQPWCSGRVGMFGTSYGGFTCVQVAAHRPPHLAAIAPMYFTDDRYTDDCHYRGGCLRGYFDVGAYGSWMIGMNAMPPYPEYSGEDWARVWEEHLAGNEPYILEWLTHQTDGPYWRPGSLRGRYDQIECPVLMIGGWRDGYANAPLRTFRELRAPRKVLFGPWNHGRPDVAIPGPRIDHLRETRRWFDRWLKDQANGVDDEPSIALYVQGYDAPCADRLLTTGYWRAEPSFPIPGASELALYLHPAQVGAVEPRVLSDAPPVAAAADPAADHAAGPAADHASDRFDYRPTVGTAGGLFSAGVPFGLPTDQRPDEVYSLNYTTAPLPAPLEIVGWPRLVLYASSTAPVAAFVARLCDVAPDGESALVCSGALNATRRSSLSDPEPLEPAVVYELNIELDCTAWRFETGHRIRLSICGADFPNLWPTPYPATNHVHRDAAHPSGLVLPVVPTRDATDEVRFEAAPPAAGPYRLSPGESAWEIAHDVLGGRTGLRLHTRDTARPGAALEVTADTTLELWASDARPADVSAIGRHQRRAVRTDGTTIADASCALRSTETAIHATIELQVHCNGLLHFQRRWVRSFPRALL